MSPGEESVIKFYAKITIHKQWSHFPQIQVFNSSLGVEAFTREAAMIDALGMDLNISNQ